MVWINKDKSFSVYTRQLKKTCAKQIYYKLSDYDSVKGIIGHESINEIIVDRLLTILGVEHLAYQLIYADVIIDRRFHQKRFYQIL